MAAAMNMTKNDTMGGMGKMTDAPGGGDMPGKPGDPTKKPSAGQMMLDVTKGGDNEKMIKKEINKIMCTACGPKKEDYMDDMKTCKNAKMFAECAKSKCNKKVDALMKLIKKCPAGSTGSTIIPAPLAVLLATMAAALVKSMA